MTIIYHNPACGTSRDGAAMTCQSGVEPDVILYLDTPPGRERLIGLIADMGITPSDPLAPSGHALRGTGARRSGAERCATYRRDDGAPTRS